MLFRGVEACDHLDDARDTVYSDLGDRRSSKALDRVLLVRSRLAEDGTHAELMRKKGAYYRLYTSQFEDEQGRALLGIRETGADEEDS